MSHSRAVVSVSFVAALFFGAGLGAAALAATPTISAGNASVAEGNSGTRTLSIPVTRTGDTTGAIAIQYRTDDHSTNPATADTDYVSISAGTAVLAAGATSFSLPISVLGDATIEPDENFFVHLTAALDVGPAPAFASPQTFATATNPFAVTMADFNGDGKRDLAVATNSSASVSVLLNTTSPGASTATFASASNFASVANADAVAQGDINGDGKPDLAVAGLVGNVAVLLNTTATGAATASFAAKVDFGGATNAFGVALGDLNGDGKPDLVFGNYGGGGVSVMLNTTATGAATPAFATRQDFATGASPLAVALADANGDGKLDVAVANYNSGTLSVLLNTTAPNAAAASFGSATNFPAGSNPRSITFADLNGDGRPDLSIASGSGGTASVLLNTAAAGAGTPSFAAAASFVTGGPGSGTLRDVNGDGRPDLIVAHGGSSSGISLLLNTTAAGASSPSFADSLEFTVGTAADVATGDLNGDGKPDLAVINNGGGTVSVLLNSTAIATPSVGFAAPENFAAGTTPYSVALGDLNGDGKPDMAVANYGSANVSVLLNSTGTGSTTYAFNAAVNFSLTGNPVSVGIGDVNADGKPDLAVASQASSVVAILLNTTANGAAAPSFSTPVTFPIDAAGYQLTFTDLNGDGKPDLSVADGGTNSTLSVLMNTTAPGAAVPVFSARQTFATGVYPSGIAAGDLNGDGKPDLVASNNNSGTVSVLINVTAPAAANANFAPTTHLGAGASAFAVTLADINSDGKLDIAVANGTSTGSVTTLLNNTPNGSTSANFGSAQTFGAGVLGVDPRSITAGDFDGDGRTDLAVAVNGSTNDVGVLYNSTVSGSSTASLSSPAAYVAGSKPYAIASGDLNADGRLDIAVTNQTGSNVSVLRNVNAPDAPIPSFSDASNFGSFGSDRFVALGDLNGDGKLDLAVAAGDYGLANISVLLNTTAPGASSPSFGPAFAFAVGNDNYSIAVGDLNGDGLPDLASTDFNGDRVAVLLNATTPGSMTPAFLAATYLTTPGGPYSVAFGDLNGDGRRDIAVAYTSGQISTFINTTTPGSTTASFAAVNNFSGGSFLTGIALGDVNGDGRPDIAAANNSNPGAVKVLVNTTAPGATAATFSSASSYSTDAFTRSVAFADLNGDGKPDIVGANLGNTLSVFFNTTAAGAPTPGFAAPVVYNVGNSTIFTVAADFNGDGKPDLVAANSNDSNVAVLFNITAAGAASPSFAPIRTFTVGSSPVALAPGDVNGDGKMDLAVANGGGANVSLLLNTLGRVTLAGTEGTGTILNDDFPDTTPDAFAFTDQTAVPVGTVRESNTIVVAGIDAAATISVSSGEYRVNSGSYTASAGTVVNGDAVQVRHTASASFNTATNTVLTIGGVSDTFTSTTESSDTTPFAFAFTDVTDVAVGSVQESNTVTITGINTTAAVSASGGEYSRNGGAYVSTAGSAVSGDTFKVRHTASLMFSTATGTTLTVGGVSDTFTSTTEAQDTAPDAFSFTDATNAALGSVQESDVVTIGGINSPASVSVSGGEYRIDSGTYTTAAATVQAGHTVQVRHTASATPATTVNTTLTVGGVSDAFSSTTVPVDTTPNAFSFTDQTGVALGSMQTSNSITVSGINSAAPISVSGGVYSVGCGATFVASAGSVNNGDTVCVRHAASSSPATTINTTLTVGGVSDTFSSTTVPADTTPVAFTFVDQANVAPGSTQTSNTVTVSGINTSTSIGVTGGSYSIGCTASFTSSAGSVNNGDTVCVRHTASASFATATGTTLTIGGVSDTFTSTTVAQDVTPAAFNFTDVTGAAAASVQQSNVVTITGITGSVAVSVSGGEYRVNSGTYTATAGTVANGDTIQLRQTASALDSTTTSVTLTVGTGSDTWTVTTAAAPPPSGGGGGGPMDLATLLALVLARGLRQRSRI